MENKKGLAKIALAALILASITPVTGHADIEAHGTVLAVGCAAHGCPAATKNGSTSSTSANDDSSYNARNPNQSGRGYSHQSYGMSNNPTGSNPSRYADYPNTYKGAGNPPSGYEGSASGGDNRPWNSGREDFREANPGSAFHPASKYGAMSGVNEESRTENDYQHNRATVTTPASTATLTESQLLGLLNPQERAVYLSLDPEAKALAIQLASQDSYHDKNLAVQEAQWRINAHRLTLNR